MCSFLLILLQHLLFCASSGSSTKSPHISLYDRLSVQTLNAIKRSLLHSLLHAQIDSIHRKAINTVCNLANNSMEHSKPRHALQAQAFAMCRDTNLTARHSAFCIFASCVTLRLGIHLDVRFLGVASVLGSLLLPLATQICGKRVLRVR